MVGAGGTEKRSQCCPLVVTTGYVNTMMPKSVGNEIVCPALFLGYIDITIFIVGDGDGNNVAGAHHCTTPVVTQRCPKMHLELFFRLKNGVVVDVNCAVLDLRKRT